MKRIALRAAFVATAIAAATGYAQELAWQQRDPYVAPSIESFFRDSEEGGNHRIDYSYPAVEGTYIVVIPIVDAADNGHLLALRMQAREK